MATRRPGSGIRRLALGVGLALAPALAGALARPAAAQQLIDPYGPYNIADKAAIYPGYYDPAWPNQSRLGIFGSRGASPFELNLNSPGGYDFGAPPGSTNFGGPGVPYFQAHRQTMRELQGEPIQTSIDDAFRQQQQEREQLYFDARKERDPKKRAELLRRYHLLSRRALLPAGAASGRANSAAAVAAPRAAAPLGRTAVAPPRAAASASRAAAPLGRVVAPAPRATAPAPRATAPATRPPAAPAAAPR